MCTLVYIPTYPSDHSGRFLQTVSCGAESKLKLIVEKQRQLVEQLQDAQGKLREAQITRQQPFVQQARGKRSSHRHRPGVAPS